MKNIKNIINNSINILVTGTLLLGIVSSSVLGIASMLNANTYVKYGLAVLVVLFAIDYLYRALVRSKKQK